DRPPSLGGGPGREPSPGTGRDAGPARPRRTGHLLRPGLGREAHPAAPGPAADHYPDRSGPVLRLARPDPGGAHPLPAGGPAGDDRDDRRASARGPRRSAIGPGSRRFRPPPVSAPAPLISLPPRRFPPPTFSAPARPS